MNLSFSCFSVLGYFVVIFISTDMGVYKGTYSIDVYVTYFDCRYYLSNNLITHRSCMDIVL